MRRDRVEIWTDILLALRRATHGPSPPPPSRIRAKVNLPHDRFWRHITELEAHGLVDSATLRTTPAGESFLRRTWDLRQELDRLRESP